MGKLHFSLSFFGWPQRNLSHLYSIFLQFYFCRLFRSSTVYNYMSLTLYLVSIMFLSCHIKFQGTIASQVNRQRPSGEWWSETRNMLWLVSWCDEGGSRLNGESPMMTVRWEGNGFVYCMHYRWIICLGTHLLGFVQNAELSATSASQSRILSASTQTYVLICIRTPYSTRRSVHTSHHSVVLKWDAFNAHFHSSGFLIYCL